MFVYMLSGLQMGIEPRVFKLVTQYPACKARSWRYLILLLFDLQVFMAMVDFQVRLCIKDRCSCTHWFSFVVHFASKYGWLCTHWFSFVVDFAICNFARPEASWSVSEAEHAKIVWWCLNTMFHEKTKQADMFRGFRFMKYHEISWKARQCCLSLPCTICTLHSSSGHSWFRAGDIQKASRSNHVLCPCAVAAASCRSSWCSGPWRSRICAIMHVCGLRIWIICSLVGKQF